MKTILLITISLILFNSSFAQIGVVTLKRNDPVYYGQWFTLKGEANKVYLLDEQEFADQAHERLLLPYELNIDEGRSDQNGNLYWTIESNCGFTSKVTRKKNEDGEVLLCILTQMTPEEEDFIPWYEKVFRTRGYLFSFSL